LVELCTDRRLFADVRLRHRVEEVVADQAQDCRIVATQCPRGDADVAVAVDCEALRRRDVMRLLARLSVRQRPPIVCTRLRGLSVAEAPQATGMSELP